MDHRGGGAGLLQLAVWLIVILGVAGFVAGISGDVLGAFVCFVMILVWWAISRYERLDP